MYLLSICDNSSVLKVFRVVGIIISIIRIAVPIILILSLIITWTKEVIGKEVKLNNGFKSSVNKLIAAIIIFFIPVLLNFVFTLAGKSLDDDGLENCGMCVSGDLSQCDASINALVAIEESKKNAYEEELKKIREAAAKKEEENKNKYSFTYQDCDTFTSSYGKTFCLYDQCDSRWANIEDFCACGCASISVISAITGFGYPATPFDNASCGVTPSTLASKLSGGKLSARKLNNKTKTAAIQEIQNGNVVIVQNSGDNLSHYMALGDYDPYNDKFYMLNSFLGKNDQHGWYTWSEIFSIPRVGSLYDNYVIYGEMNPLNN